MKKLVGKSPKPQAKTLRQMEEEFETGSTASASASGAANPAFDPDTPVVKVKGAGGKRRGSLPGGSAAADGSSRTPTNKQTNTKTTIDLSPHTIWQIYNLALF